MDTTSVNELKKLVQNFCEERDWDQFHTLKELSIGISTEAAELLDIFRFQSEEQIQALLDDPVKKENISDELSDVLFFVLRLSQRFDIDLTSSLKNKIEKNAKKYPVEKSIGKNTKYTDL